MNTAVNPKVKLICNAMSEVRQYIIAGKNQPVDVLTSHIQYQFSLEKEDAELIVNHLLAIADNK